MIAVYYCDEELAGLVRSSSRINNWQMDTLIRLARGVISDGVVSQEETEYLHTRLANNGMTDNIMVDVPLHRIDRMLSDGLLGKDVIPDPNKR